MRSSPSLTGRLSALAAALWMACAGCGGSKPPTSAETNDRPEVLIAVVHRYGAPPGDPGPRSQTEVAFRYAGGTWLAIELPRTTAENADVSFLPLGIAIADRDTAFLWGWVGENNSGLLRTDDAGASWSDASSILPADVQLIEDLAFSTDRAWLVSGGLFGGLFVYDSANPLSSWRPYAVEFPFRARAAHRFILRRAQVDVVYNARWVKQLLPSSVSDVIDTAGGSFNAEDVVVSDDRAWIAGSDDSAMAIVAGSIAEPWVQQEIESPRQGRLLSIDVRGDAGVACGDEDLPAVGEVEPSCFFTEDGARWRPATLPNEVSGMRIARVVRAAGATAWAVAQGVEAELPLRLLRSDDGGRSWTLSEQPFGGASAIVDLVRMSATP